MKPFFYILPCLFLLWACDPGQPSDGASNSNAIDFKATGAAEALEQDEFNALSPENQYLIANKVLSMMQKGVPVDEFFNLSSGIDNLSVTQTSFIDELRNSLLTELSADERNAINNEIYGVDETGVPDPDLAKYRFFREEDEPRLLPYAQIMEYPVSRNMFAAWIAHFLANTIMFSPAYEMESTDEVDIARIMSTLQLKVLAGDSVRDIIRQHLPTVSRWRVSRSAENHALEAYELYLGLFDTEEDSRKGGIACQEFFLTDDDAGYQLSRTPFINTEPQIILEDYVITSCDELYDVVAGHPLLMLRVTEVIVNYFMDGRSSEDRLAVVESIVNSGANTFEDIFKGILFSREFLLNTERPISYENNALSMLDRLRADRVGNQLYSRDIFNNLAGGSFFADRQANMHKMGWASSEYKIGRTPNVPMDPLSFASHHKAMRESLINSENAWRGGGRRINDESPWVSHVGLLFEGYDSDDDDTDIDDTRVRPILERMNVSQIIDYCFVTLLARKATNEEKQDLITYLDDPDQNFIDEDPDNPGVYFPRGDLNTFFWEMVAVSSMDYISRLSEFYYQKAIN